MTTLKDRLETNKNGPHKLLALDGGGIRGIKTIKILARIEALLREREDKPRLVLADYFDYIGGTSTGAIIATCLALGKSCAEVEEFYLESGSKMFDRARIWNRLRYKYDADALADKLREVLGPNARFGDDRLRTLLMVVLRNATTDSPWPLSNNPFAKYNNPQREDNNLNFPLWKLVRASTAAPTYFPPEVIELTHSQRFTFQDGGVTMYNNPAFKLFLMATSEPYRLNWPTGKDNMLLVSVGTGSSAAENFTLGPDGENIASTAISVISALMNAAAAEQDILCRTFGDCRFGSGIDSELGDLCKIAPVGPEKLFSYVRYDPDVSRAGLDALGLRDIEPDDVQAMDSVKYIDEMSRVGEAYARKHVKPEHFVGFAL